MTRTTIVTMTLRASVSEDGMAGPPTFYAEEAGQAIGTPATIPDPARCVSVGVVQLAKGSRA